MPRQKPERAGASRRAEGRHCSAPRGSEPLAAQATSPRAVVWTCMSRPVPPGHPHAPQASPRRRASVAARLGGGGLRPWLWVPGQAGASSPISLWWTCRQHLLYRQRQKCLYFRRLPVLGSHPNSHCGHLDTPSAHLIQ